MDSSNEANPDDIRSHDIPGQVRRHARESVSVKSPGEDRVRLCRADLTVKGHSRPVERTEGDAAQFRFAGNADQSAVRGTMVVNVASSRYWAWPSIDGLPLRRRRSSPTRLI